MKHTINRNQLDNIIHIWSANLEQPEAIIEGYYSILSDHEKKEVDRYKTEGFRNRRIISMGLLRILISKYTNYRPNEVIFYYNEFGKPSILPDSDGTKLFFNLSHSGNIAVFVFSGNREIGIDVEKVVGLADMEGVIDLCFSGSEKKWFSKLPSAKKEEMFYKIWTCKEAYIKAIGKGLSFSPNRIILDRRDNDELFIKKINGDEDFNRWKLITFKLYYDFISSVVVENHDFSIEHFRLSPHSIFNNDIQFSAV